jgi:hypothetical protein
MKNWTILASTLVVAVAITGVAVTQPPPGQPPPRGPGARPRGVSADDLVERLMAFDKNKDGKVTKDELPERMHYLIELGDTNKDGALDRDEIKKLAARLSEEGPPRPAPGDRPPPPPPPGPGGLERILDDLKLSDKQLDKANVVLKAHHEKMRKIHEQARADLLKEMKDVLSADQFKKFKDELEKQGPPGPPRPPR